MDEEVIKIFLFARWLATSYADTHMDSNLKSEYDLDFNPETALSVLNREDGYWYLEKLNFFLKVIYPEYVNNGTVNNHIKAFENFWNI